MKKSLIIPTLVLLGAAVPAVAQETVYDYKPIAVTTQQDATRYVCKRPPVEERLFRSDAVERVIRETQARLTNPKLRWMMGNCFPNTLDTTVHFRHDEDGEPDTFVYTGDIAAMWLRDSAAQVYPYVALASEDPQLAEMLRGVIRRQMKLICLDPYANAFLDGDLETYWATDMTEMRPGVHERKWEIDSLCYPIRLAYAYWSATGDSSILDEHFHQAMRLVLQTLREQQRKGDRGPYSFMRETERSTDSKSCDGWGEPVNPVGLIVSSFRPSDDATHYQFLIPSNFFAVTSCRKAASLLRTGYGDEDLATELEKLADEVEGALRKYAVVSHPTFGKVYAYEVDGYGNCSFMDDANVPSLLAMGYLGDVDPEDPIYRNTRRLVWSECNPYFFHGTAGEGIGGPHVGYDMVWPMSIMMRAFTSTDDDEIRACMEQLLSTDADTGLMHESFHKDDPTKYTRSWFAWQNTLFGELVLTLIERGKLDLLNSL